MGYGAVCAFVGMIAMILDFQRFYRKHHQLKKVCEQINVTKEHLPSTKQLLEQDYQEIIYTLYQQRQELSDQMNNKYTDLVEYYTIWATPNQNADCFHEAEPAKPGYRPE